jgi:hypothetical protein
MTRDTTNRNPGDPTGVRRFLAVVAGVVALVFIAIAPHLSGPTFGLDAAGPSVTATEEGNGLAPDHDLAASADDATAEGVLPDPPRVAAGLPAARPAPVPVARGPEQKVSPLRRPPRRSAAT